MQSTTALASVLQEDLTVADMEEILDDLKAGKTPQAGPRSVGGL